MTAAQIRLTDRQISDFMEEHRLPEKFRNLIHDHYSALADVIRRMRNPGTPLFIGINGAQGTGKSTLADYLKLELDSGDGWNVAVLSIDDFYLTKAERRQIARDIHPLFETRGVPGTHDMKMLKNCVQQLRSLAEGESLALPRFDKATDDRADKDAWPKISGPVDLVILEGWCVGTLPQAPGSLSDPINSLERNEDQGGSWRLYVNSALQQEYAEVYGALDALIFLKAPSFDAIYRWRREQERKLTARSSGTGSGLMNDEQLLRFVQHFERLTRANLSTLPDKADVMLELDENHDCVRSVFANRSGAARSPAPHAR